MARKRSTRRQDYDDTVRRKTEDEARIERVTWFLLVLVFAVINLAPDTFVLPNAAVPMAGAVILLGSGGYQYSRRMRVSPITWIAGSFMLFMALYNLYFDSTVDFLGLTLIVFAIVIGFGVLTGET